MPKKSSSPKKPARKSKSSTSTKPSRQSKTQKIQVKIVAKEKYVPKYQTDGAACADLVAFMPPNVIDGVDIGSKILLKHRYPVSVGTGVKVAVPEGFKMCVAVRSGLAKRGLMLLNGVGQIDSDYRGEVVLLLVNVGSELIEIKDGDRIAQCWLEQVYQFDWETVEELDVTARNAGGLGSTGK